MRIALLLAGLNTSIVASGAIAATVDSSKPRIFGHRGDMSVVLENSRAGITSAVSNGAYGVEFDVRMTSTGYAVVMHDSTMTRTSTACKGKYVHKMTGTQFKACKLNNGENAPSLDNFFYHGNKKSTSLRYFLELKVVPTSTQAKRIMATMTKYGVTSRVKIISFSASALNAMRSAGWKGRGGWLFTSDSGWTQNMKYDRHPYGPSITQAKVNAAHAKKLWVCAGSDGSESNIRTAVGLGIDEISVNNVAQAVQSKYNVLRPPTTTTTTTTTTIPTTTTTETTTTDTTTTSQDGTTTTTTTSETTTTTTSETTSETIAPTTTTM